MLQSFSVKTSLSVSEINFTSPFEKNPEPPDLKHLWKKYFLNHFFVSAVTTPNSPALTILIQEVILWTFFCAVIMQTKHETILCDVGLECVSPFPLFLFGLLVVCFITLPSMSLSYKKILILKTTKHVCSLLHCRFNY